MTQSAVAVVNAEEARERDRLAIESGTPSRVLMHSAGVAAARRILHHYKSDLSGGVEIHVGPGNNGGDGWVVAGELAGNGFPVRVVEASPAKTDDAVAARTEALRAPFAPLKSSPSVIVDALLGTGSRGELKVSIRAAADAINSARSLGAKVVALDIPTGLDASTGQAFSPVRADLTISFGTIKRGHLTARPVCGRIEVVDIGLGDHGVAGPQDVTLASRDWVAGKIPAIEGTAHKGTRKRLAIVAGDIGMGGAAILSGRGALRSGIGLLHLIVSDGNRDAVHAGIPAALLSSHDELLHGCEILGKADAIVVGPGLSPSSAVNLLKALRAHAAPVLLDAGALTAFAADRSALKEFCAGRQVVLTPHTAEMARLMSVETAEVLDLRFEVGSALATETGATVLLKGTPTIVSDPAGRRFASATGTAALATGGSGDILSGIVGTLLAQTGDAFSSAVCGAWVHGRAAEICGRVRGVTLDDILYAMPAAWDIQAYGNETGVLASLPLMQ